MITRADIVDEARTWLGTRWQHQGCVKGVGVDCVGLIGGVALALRLPGAREWRDAPAWHQYGRKPDPRTLLAGCDALMDRIPIDAAGAGDVLVLQFGAGPQHFAIVSGEDPPAIIHALAQARKVAEARLDDTWRARIVRAYRYRGVD